MLNQYKSLQRRGLSTLAIATASAFLAYVPVYAQNMPAEESSERELAPDERDVILVTASRKFRPEISSAASKLALPIVETPQALTVLSSEFLEIAKLRTTEDVVAYTAGVEHAGTGDGTEAILVARGFPIDRERSYRVNGLSVDSEIDFDYFAMERVEVVRGPASSLYGEADYGATLNRVLKRPSRASAISVSAEMGTDSHHRLETDLTGALNQSGTISGRVVAAIQDSKRFIRDTDDNRWVVAPSVTIDLENTVVDLQVYYSRVTGSSSDGFPLLWEDDAGGNRTYFLPDYEDIPRSANYGAEWHDIDSSNQFYYVGVDHQLSNALTANLRASYSRISMENLSTYLFSLAGDGTSGVYASFEDKTKENLSVEGSLEASFELFGQEQRVLVSGDWRKNERFQPSWDFSELARFNFLEVEGPYEITQPSPLFVEGDYFAADQEFYGASLLAYLKPTERLSFLLGLRYSGIDSLTDTFRPSANRFSYAAGSDHDWVPRAGAVYNIAGSHHIYLSYAEGIIFNETSLGPNGVPIAPEQGVQYEAGLKGELFDDRLLYSLSGFRIKRSNVATVIDPNPGGIPIAGNIGSQVHKGFEAEIVGEPLPGLNLVGSYAFLDVEITESARPAEIGQRPRAAPKHSFSLFGTYEILSGPLESFTLGGGFVARSSRQVDNVGSFALPGYKRVDLRFAYSPTENLLLEFNVQNLFNERIFTSQYASPRLGIAYSQPFRAIGGVSYRF